MTVTVEIGNIFFVGINGDPAQPESVLYLIVLH
jgi:hypothetical protein